MKDKPESEGSNMESRNIKRKSDLSAIIENLPSDSIIRINNAEIDINKTWYKLSDVELQMAAEGIKINKGKVNDCVTSW